MFPPVYLIGALAFGYAMGKSSEPAPRKKSLRALPPAPPSPIMSIGENCSSWQILDQPRFELTFKFIYVRERLHDVTSPLDIASAVAKELVPMCIGYGKMPRNAGEQGLYAALLNDVIIEMREDSTFTPAQLQTAEAQAAAWIAASGAP